MKKKRSLMKAKWISKFAKMTDRIKWKKQSKRDGVHKNESRMRSI